MSRWGLTVKLPSLDFTYRVKDEYDGEVINEVTGTARAYATCSNEETFCRFIDKDKNFIGGSSSNYYDAQRKFLNLVEAFLIRMRKG